MWNIGAATSSRWYGRSGVAATRDSIAQSWPAWPRRTPFGRPVEPDVYRIIAMSSSPGTTVSNGPGSANASSSPRSSSTAARPAGQAARRSASQNASATPASARTYSMVGRGSFQFTGTATIPARMMARKATRYSARFADTIAMRSPR